MTHPAILDRIRWAPLKDWREFVDYSGSLTDVGLPTEVPYLFRGQAKGMSPWLLNLVERGGLGAQHTALATVVTIAEARA